ncbi:MAG: hypothetical protein ABI559_05340 [Chloroflexota bacterium]
MSNYSRPLTLVLIAVLAIVVSVGGHPARAAFPGTNGRIAYVDSTNGYLIELVNPNGSGRTSLSNALDDATAPAWSPDGSEIVYTRGTNPYRLRIAEVGGPSDDGIANTDGGSQPAWSPDSQKIVFRYEATPGALGDIVVINRNGSGFLNLTNTPNEDEYTPAWSPDGQHIVFIRDTVGVEDLWIMDPDGGNQRNVSNDPDRGETSPDWSPSGTSVVLDYVDGDNQRIGIMDIQTGALTPVTNGFPDFDPSFSPNGEQIVFERYLPSANALPQGGSIVNIIVIDADGQNETNISTQTSNTRDYYPNWGVDIPGPPPLTWGDNNCSGAHDPTDALFQLREQAEFHVIGGGCPLIGQLLHSGDFGDLKWGDLNCSGGFDLPDVLLLLADAAGLPPANLADCPALGTEIALPPG